MKHKRLKALITMSLFIIAIALAIVPSYSYNYSTLQVYVIDVSSSSSYTKTISIDQNITSAYVIYDPSTSTINIELGIHDDIETYFITYMPSTFVCVIDGVEVKNMQGYYSYDLGIDLSATNATLSVTLEMTDTNYGAIYTQDQYENYGNYSAEQAIQNVLDNPNAYNLYTLEQRNTYGTSEYNRGRKASIDEFADGEVQEAYNSGLAQGHKDSETAKTLLNVGLSGIYNTFLYITQNTGIFGVSLIGIIASCLIIVIIYMVYKLVRG